MILKEKPTLLLMACCAPCACAFFAFGLHNKYDTTLFFCGDNFDCREEYDRRLHALETVNKEQNGGKAMILLPYKEGFTFADKHRCEKCIEARLRLTATTAAKNNFNYFSTTLTVSPHKDTRMINIIGAYVGLDCDAAFLELDLKKGGGFQKSVEVSKALGLYRQNYCGCKKSLAERNTAHKD